MHRHRQIAARQLVFALRPRLDPAQTLGNRPVDGLMVAQFEMQEGVVFGAAPVASVQRVAPDEVQRRGNGPAVAFRQHQQDVIAHGRVEFVKGPARQIGRAPFARPGVLVEGPEMVPVLRLDLISGQRPDGTAKALRNAAFLAQGLALARRQLCQEIVIAGIARIFPVKLLRCPPQKAQGRAPVCLGFGAEGDMQRRQAVGFGKLDRPPDQGRRAFSLKPRKRQEAPAGGRGEGDGKLQLGIVPPARALPGIGPGVIEDVFALAVRLGIKRCRRDDAPVLPHDKRAGLPAGARAGGS